MNKLTLKSLPEKDWGKISALIALAAVIGIYRIASTVMISKDGVLYIEMAKGIASSTYAIPGLYPFFIKGFYNWFGRFLAQDNMGWIYSAQLTSLSFQLLSIIPLYFIGRFFVGQRKAFFALLILLLLPYPAEFGSDTIRESCNIFFLSAGVCAFLYAARNESILLYGLAGIFAGIGFFNRPECMQVVIYAGFWLVWRLFTKKEGNKVKAVISLLLLGIISGIALFVFSQIYGQILPAKLKHLFSEFAQPATSVPILYSAGFDFGNFGKAISEAIKKTCENLLWFFVPALIAGLIHFFKDKSQPRIAKYFILSFIVLNILMQILLYYDWGYISRRHNLPLVVMTVFFVPSGLELMAVWIKEKFKLSSDAKKICTCLIITGIIICIPKLLRPLNYGKKGFVQATNWLKENTAKDAKISVPDNRILLYSQRDGRLYKTSEKPDVIGTDYVVILFEKEDKIGSPLFQIPLDTNNKKSLAIYGALKID